MKQTLIALLLLSLVGCQIQSGKVYPFSSLVYHYRAGFIHAEPLADQDFRRYEKALSKGVVLDPRVVGWGPDECRVVRWEGKTYLFVIPDFSIPVSAWVAEVNTFGRLWWNPKWITPLDERMLLSVTDYGMDFVSYMDERYKKQKGRRASLPKLKPLFR